MILEENVSSNGIKLYNIIDFFIFVKFLIKITRLYGHY